MGSPQVAARFRFRPAGCRRSVVAAAIAAVAALAPLPLGAQTAVPRTPDGKPDLHGIWDFRTITPLERPGQCAGKDVLTAKEAAAIEQRNAETRVDRAPRTGDPGTYNQFWFDFSSRVVDDKRTSLIVDPADGRGADAGRGTARRRPRRDAATTGDRPRGSPHLGALPPRVQLRPADHAERRQQQRSAGSRRVTTS